MKKVPGYEVSNMPILKRSYEWLAESFERVPSLVADLLHPFGVNRHAVICWSRPKANKENPTATGKGNPIDRIEKFLEIQHPKDPEMARQIAEHFPIFVDELDRRAGFDEAVETENPCAAFARVIESHSKLIKISLNGCANPENLPEALERTQSLKTFVLQLESCLKKNIQDASGEKPRKPKKEERPMKKRKK